MKNLQRWSLLCGLLGFALLVAGLALYSVPVALVVAGLFLLAYAVLLDKASAALHRQTPVKESKG